MHRNLLLILLPLVANVANGLIASHRSVIRRPTYMNESPARKRVSSNGFFERENSDRILGTMGLNYRNGSDLNDTTKHRNAQRGSHVWSRHLWEAIVGVPHQHSGDAGENEGKLHTKDQSDHPLYPLMSTNE